MTPLRFLGLLFGRCAHDHHYVERDQARVLWLVCDRCGRRVEALQMTPEERETQRETYRLPAPQKAHKRRKGQHPATVTPIRRRGSRA